MIFGSNAMGEGANAATGGQDAAVFFPGVVAKDVVAHPFMYAIHAAGLALPFLHVPQAVEGIATGVEALITAYDLGKETH